MSVKIQTSWLAIIGGLSLVGASVVQVSVTWPDVAAKLIENLPAIFMAVASIIAALAALDARKKAGAAVSVATETHNLVNSRMTELLEISKTASEAKGKAEGQVQGAKDERLRSAEAGPSVVEYREAQKPLGTTDDPIKVTNATDDVLKVTEVKEPDEKAKNGS